MISAPGGSLWRIKGSAGTGHPYARRRSTVRGFPFITSHAPQTSLRQAVLTLIHTGEHHATRGKNTDPAAHRFGFLVPVLTCRRAETVVFFFGGGGLRVELMFRRKKYVIHREYRTEYFLLGRCTLPFYCSGTNRMQSWNVEMQTQLLGGEAAFSFLILCDSLQPNTNSMRTMSSHLKCQF